MTTSKNGIQSWCLFNKLFDMFSDNKQWKRFSKQNPLHLLLYKYRSTFYRWTEVFTTQPNQQFIRHIRLEIAIWLESHKFPTRVNGYVKSPFSGSHSSKRKYLPLTKYSDGIEMWVMDSSSTQQKYAHFQERLFIICVPRVERTARKFHFIDFASDHWNCCMLEIRAKVTSSACTTVRAAKEHLRMCLCMAVWLARGR